ncbi:MAG: nucleoside hydrolase [Trueperaceae bacterium]|nr:nucleoside hydrolase [Trueperaceae bacterium]
MSDAPRILLDCDPGHDDAFALLFAARRCDVVAITTVSGNAPVDATTRNALVLTEVAGLNVPVHRGAAGPLVGAPRHAPDVHGEGGLAGPDPRTPTRAADPLPAAQAIVRAAQRYSDLWLVGIGPLTNIALAMHLDPELPRRVRGISLMAGSRSFGNATAAAEFNVLADPEAADTVFRSGAQLVMAGLDLTHQFRLGQPEVDALQAMPGEVGAFAAELLTFFHTNYQRRTGRQGAPMHDVCAVMALSDPTTFEREATAVTVELRGQHTRGMTVCDLRDPVLRGTPNAEVLTRIDADAARATLLRALAGEAAAR